MLSGRMVRVISYPKGQISLANYLPDIPPLSTKVIGLSMLSPKKEGVAVKKYLTNFVKQSQRTPQNQPLPGTSQVKNSAGGYVWEVSQWERLKRFLILGSE